MEKGKQSKLEVLEVEMMKHQKFLPHCAQVHFNKCQECTDTAVYFEKHLPRTIMMASSILGVTRAYEVLVECGFYVDLYKKQDNKSLLLFEPTVLDITPKKLRNLIEHHPKMCLCSICKFWIISDIQQTEL